MVKKKQKFTKRVLSLVLVFVITIGFIPTKAYAKNTNYPEDFTICVKDINSIGVSNATVSYEILNNSLLVKAGSVSTDTTGYVAITDMATYVTDVMSGTITLNYTVSKSGYTTQSINDVPISDAKGNIDVNLLEDAPSSTNVSVTKIGSGTVKINNNESVGTTVKPNDTITLEVTPIDENDGRTYIKNLMIGTETIPVNTYETYNNESLVITQNTPIYVEFVTTYTIVSNADEGGTITLNGNSEETITVDSTSLVNVVVTPNEGYQIANITIGNNNETITNPSLFSENIAITGNISISATFVKVYKSTITYDETKGIVVTNPINDGGQVIVEENKQITIIATPNTNYRVSKVTKNEEVTEFIDNDKEYEGTIMQIDQNDIYEIMFAPNTYVMTTNQIENGSVEIEKTVVAYNNDTKVTIIPDDGYILDTVSVNGVYVEVEQLDNDTAQFRIENIEENKNIVVYFVTMPVVDTSHVTLNADDAIRFDVATNQYVFSEEEEATFSTTKEGIKINGDGHWQQNVNSINETITATDIQLYYKGDGELRASWHKIELPTGGIKIVIDETKPIVTVTPDTANTNNYYNNTVNVSISAEDPGAYSGIETVAYWVKCDGIVTQHETISVDREANYNGNILVDASLNNSDNVEVIVTVTDVAGNTETEITNIMINTTRPTVNISIDGQLHAEAMTSYFNTDRVATITIVDRASSFDEMAALNGLEILATNHDGTTVIYSKAAMMSWVHNGDTHIGTLVFSEDAYYEWSFTYTNKAGLSNDSIIEEGDSLYEFTIDKTAPTGLIHQESSTWDQIVNVITFGIWKNYPITVETTVSDITSPVYDVLYYKTDATVSLRESELEALYESGDFVSEAYTVSTNEQFVIYARITDYAGNTLYISTDGMIVDTTTSDITLIADAPNENGFYSDDGSDYVNIDIIVKDNLLDNSAYSGIKTVDYTIESNGEITQAGNLYTFDKIQPTKEELCTKWVGNIQVDKTKNNSDQVKVKVVAEDNAGNIFEKAILLSIHIDPPIVNIAFHDTANRVEDENGYFGADRTATITVVDKISVFDAEEATKGIQISAVDGKKENVELDIDSMISEWSSTGDVHTATITFITDGNYEWSFDYTNKADNSIDRVSTTGTTPFTFTVDKASPSGAISIKDNTWDALLSVLTFGLYSQIDVNVTALYGDTTSPVDVAYYKTNNPIAMSVSELEAQTFIAYNDFSVTTDEQFTVYLKITDYAGNYTYISSDGYIIDTVNSEITLLPEAPNENGIYNKNVNVAISITDAAPYSGIKTVDYWVIKDNDSDNPTQEGNLFTFDNMAPTHAELINTWNDSIEVNAEMNNSSNVVVYVRTIDNAGNEEIQSIPLDIDITKPTIRVSYNNDNSENGYFNAERTATIVITERTNHFDERKATEGIVMLAVDAKGKTVSIDSSTMISGWTTKEGATADEATHTATINYAIDANYTFAISYMDQAGNRNKGVDTGDAVSPHTFTVDTTAPTGTLAATSIEGRVSSWDTLAELLTFGFWSSKGITITNTADDTTSPIASVSYYKTDAITALSKNELQSITSWETFETLSITANEKCTVYLRIIDMAGNTSYISTNGLIVDDTQPQVEYIAPEITVNPQQPMNGIYNGDVNVDIEVNELVVEGVYSGLKTVTYRVLNRGEETQSGTLYTFEKEAPTHDQLVKHWSGSITVDSTLNNSNDVVIEIYAQDNALNASTDKVAIKIDTTPPVIAISYDNNNPENGKYYNAPRQATIVITERNFDPKEVFINITNTNGVIPTISGWIESPGSGNQDNKTYTTTITYVEDGDYTFEIACTDLANNKTTEAIFVVGTTNEKEFTIDRTKPEMAVSYDNNSAQNSKYFNASRTATVVIKEHNFDVNRVAFTQTASIDGEPISIPSVSWSSNSDIHTATITYHEDGDYTFDVTMQDMAGNVSDEANHSTSVAAKDFTIDTFIAEPTITGVENGMAYKDEIIPAIDFFDSNYNDYEVRLTRTRKNERNDTVTEQFINSISINDKGGASIHDTFEKIQDNDGIYTLYVKVADKAGNESEKTVVFTANRFGSVYEYHAYLMALISDGGAYVQSIEKDLIITEYNADTIISDSLLVQITRDGRPLDTVKYKVSPEMNPYVNVGVSGWYQYEYVISKENFTEDGVYKMSISSVDATGNTPENTNYEGLHILFRVDSTAPELTSVVGLEKNIINAQEVTVDYTVFDAIGLQSITVYVNDKQHGDKITKFDDRSNYAGMFIMTESNTQQSIRLIIEDQAGNITDTDADAFTSAYTFERTVMISTNFFVRWYANTLLFWSSISSIVVIGGILFVLFKKKTKSEEE